MDTAQAFCGSDPSFSSPFSVLYHTGLVTSYFNGSCASADDNETSMIFWACAITRVFDFIAFLFSNQVVYRCCLVLRRIAGGEVHSRVQVFVLGFYSTNQVDGVQIFGDNWSYLTHCSTLSMLACSNPRASKPTQTRSIEVSPERTVCKKVPPDPSWRRIGRELH